MKSSFKQLQVWQKSVDLADTIYDIIERFPEKECLSLSDQMSRAAVSVASNLAEGSVRNSKKDFARFVVISRGSLAELETQLIIALRRKYMNKEKYDRVIPQIDDISKMLSGLQRFLKLPTDKEQTTNNKQLSYV